MPEGLSDALDAPIPITIGGTEYELSLLTMDDLTVIGRQIQERAKQKVLKGLPLTAPPEQRQAIANDFDARESQVDEITNYLFTLPGATAFLKRSLAKANVKGVDADAVVKRYAQENGWQAVVLLARRVSGIFPPVRAKADEAKGEGGDPNSPAGAASPAPETTAATE